MTVKQNATTSAKSKKKTASGSSSKTVTKKVEEVGTLSKSSSSSSLQISDVSHLPVQTSSVQYSVTETLPQETGEKITHYTETGASSTEYRHYIAQDTSSKQATNITQISSILNQSTQNLAKTDDANVSYTVVEPVEERLTYNKNDSTWNGKFVVEKPTTTRSFHQESSQQSSSVVKSSSSSKVIEIVDGKERIVDEKHHEKAEAASSSREEQLTSKSGTGIAPELHHTKRSRDSTTAYDSARPELAQPKTETRESFKETHQVGDERASNAYQTRDVTNVSLDALGQQAFKTVTDETGAVSKGGKDVATTTTYYDSKGNVIKTVDGSRRIEDHTSKTSTRRDRSESTKKETASSFAQEQTGTSKVSTSTTYYDSKGNVIKTVTDSGATEGANKKSTKRGKSDTKTKEAASSVSKDKIGSSTVSTTTTYYDSKGNIIKTVSDSDVIPEKTTTRGDSTFILSDNSTNTRSDVKHAATSSFLSKEQIASSGTTTTYYDSKGKVIKTETGPGATSGSSDLLNTTYIVDDASSVASDATYTLNDSKSMASDVTYTLEDSGFVDSSKIRQTATDSRDFYGSSEQVINDNTEMYTNERTYGKTGWNGRFVYETPTKPKRAPSPAKKGPKKTSTPTKDDKIVSETYTTIETKRGPTPTGQLETIYTETVYKSVDDLTDIKDGKTSVTNVEYVTKSKGFADVKTTSEVVEDVKVHVDKRFDSKADVVDFRTSKDVKVSLTFFFLALSITKFF